MQYLYKPFVLNIGSMQNKRLFISCLILLFSLDSMSQGLFFHGIDTDMQKRSTFSVFNNKSCIFKDYFEISFKFSLCDVNSYGYLFLLEDINSKREYNLMYMYESKDYSSFKFNIGSKKNILTIRIKNKQLEKRKWVNFSSRFDLNADSVCVTIDGQSFSKKKLNLPKRFEPNLMIGFIKSYVELPPFKLRTLKVGNEELNYSFPLNESTGNDVHDSEGNIVGMVSNPVWLINSAYHWKLRFAVDSLPLNGVNYQPTSQNMLFFHNEFIRVYNVLTNKSSSHKYVNRIPLSIWLGDSFLDEKNKELYVYEIRDCKNCQGAMSSLDLNHYKWRPVCNDWLPMQLHHHSGYFDAKQNKYIIFGGFGNRMYNRHFYVFDLLKQKWDTLHYSGDRISPRYFQGMAASNNNLYILGGMGNDAGVQEIGRRNYYDLYKFNLEKKKCTKLWEINWEKKNIVFARNMVAFGDSLLYALCYPEYESNTYAQLYKFSIKDGTYEILGDSIRFWSQEILTNINLFYDKKLQEFYCAVQEVDKNGLTNSRIYSLAYPGATMKDLLKYNQTVFTFRFWYLMIILGFLSTLLIVYKLVIWRKSVRKTGKMDLKYFVENEENLGFQTQRKESSVFLFGDFTLYDKVGRDITYMLSARLKNTFLLILEYSLLKGGITSSQLSDMLWSDKDKYSAKDLRGVTINQLRKILLELNGFKLVFDKSLYILTIEDECFCDCKYILGLMDLAAEDMTKIYEINGILSRGVFLKSIETPLLDSFKLFMKERLIANLPIYIEKVFKLSDYSLTVQLSDHLLLIDPLHVQALSFQLRSLYSLNQKSEAKKRYILFSQNYNKLTGQYPRNLMDLLNSK